MTEYQQSPVERYGSSEAWENELGVSWEDLRGHLRGHGAAQTYGFTEVQQAIELHQAKLAADRAKMIEKIRQAARNPINLICIGSQDSKCMKIKALGFKSWRQLAGYFGLEGNPWDTYAIRVSLAAIVFGEDHPDLQPRIAEEEECRKSPEEPVGPTVARWITSIKKEYPSSKEWLSNFRPPSRSMFSYGKPSDESGLVSWEYAIGRLCSRYGIDVNALSHYQGHELKCKVGLIIYGEQDSLIAKALQEIQEGKEAIRWLDDGLKNQPADVKAALLKSFPTIGDWFHQVQNRTHVVLPYITVDTLARFLSPRTSRCELDDDYPGIPPIKTVAIWLYGAGEHENFSLHEEERKRERTSTKDCRGKGQV